MQIPFSEYTPNFNDPRVIKRVCKAISFINSSLSSTFPRSLSQSRINKHFGCPNSNLNKYLREKLLVIASNSYSYKGTNHWTKTYTLNEKGLKYLTDICAAVKFNLKTYAEVEEIVSKVGSPDLDILKQRCNIVVLNETFMEKYGEQLESGNIVYCTKSNRDYNPMQNTQTASREVLMYFYGYSHNYDIQACAPTLLLQLSQRAGLEEYLPAYRDYLDDRAKVRVDVAQDVGATVDQIKLVCNALLCGARLGASPRFSLFRALNCDYTLMKKLKNHPFILQFKQDIKVMWSYLKPLFPTEHYVNQITKKKRKAPLSPRQKWSLYFKSESDVRDVVKRYLPSVGNKLVLEHDGWRTVSYVDPSLLTRLIKEETGFDVKLDYSTLIDTRTGDKLLNLNDKANLAQAIEVIRSENKASLLHSIKSLAKITKRNVTTFSDQFVARLAELRSRSSSLIPAH